MLTRRKKGFFVFYDVQITQKKVFVFFFFFLFLQSACFKNTSTRAITCVKKSVFYVDARTLMTKTRTILAAIILLANAQATNAQTLDKTVLDEQPLIKCLTGSRRRHKRTLWAKRLSRTS